MTSLPTITFTVPGAQDALGTLHTASLIHNNKLATSVVDYINQLEQGLITIEEYTDLLLDLRDKAAAAEASDHLLIKLAIAQAITTILSLTSATASLTKSSGG